MRMLMMKKRRGHALCRALGLELLPKLSTRIEPVSIACDGVLARLSSDIFC